MRRLFVLHLIGNALLLWLGYYWLGVGESSNAYLAYSVGVVLLFTIGALWLHGTAFARFQQNRTLPLPNLPPLFVLAVIVAAIYAGLSYANTSFGHEAFVIGSYTTMKLRRPVAPGGVLRAFHIFIWLLRWLVVPVLALPLASEVANRGWVSAFRTSRRPLYWLQSLALLLLAIWVPIKLFHWVPKMPNFTLEAISVFTRLGLAYLLFVGSLLTLEFLTAASSNAKPPREFPESPIPAQPPPHTS